MSANAPLLSGTIEPDEEAPSIPRGNIGTSSSPRPAQTPVVLVPGTQASGVGNAEEGGIVGVLVLNMMNKLTRDKEGYLEAIKPSYGFGIPVFIPECSYRGLCSMRIM